MTDFNLFLLFFSPLDLIFIQAELLLLNLYLFSYLLVSFFNRFCFSEFIELLLGSFILWVLVGGFMSRLDVLLFYPWVLKYHRMHFYLIFMWFMHFFRRDILLFYEGLILFFIEYFWNFLFGIVYSFFKFLLDHCIF